MTTIKVLPGQSVFDIALMVCGTPEAWIDIEIALRAGIENLKNTEELGDSALIVIDIDEINKKVVDYYAINSVTPATDFIEPGEE